ncbi:flagellar basal body P-ring formation chaperone FlgA [Paraburkholderia sp.]|uniref:flagellar basal body P-ring formation chaperone FlgA n=1 Tax=Paraburkholderia sp. TaxID=1926495 RepID=UPI00286F8E5F|nr:flagellar basal body P-ring formation chaperone FlgA [Paraburkholderia sp.]
MPQTAHPNARRATAHRHARGRSQRLAAATAALLGAMSAISAMTFATAARAQSDASASSGASGQQIYIAGPGDRAGSDAAKMSAMLAQPARAADPAANAKAYADRAALLTRNNGGSSAQARAEAEAQQPGMITSPGAGERGNAAAQNDAPTIVTVGASGAASTPQRAVAPVVVQAAPRVVQPNVPAVNANATNAYANTNANTNANTRANGAIMRASYAPRAAVNANGNAAAMNAAAQAQAQAAQVPPGQEDGERIRATALAFLQQQSAGLPGKVNVTVGTVFPRGLAACAALEPFMPPGARMWGRTTVGVRCVGAKPWTLYVVGRVAVDVTYYVAARQINAGEALSAADYVPRDGDLASLPQTIITDPDQANGAVALMRITQGLPLRSDMLRSASSVVIGQTVKVIAVGTNFTISSEGSVLNNAAPGQMVRVRTPNGQIISGVVKDASTVQIQI